MRANALFACIDDKHRIKVGEPERVRQIIVPSGSQLLAGDHDFTKYSLIPSVVRLYDITEEISVGLLLVSIKTTGLFNGQ